jgi:hypothetical protein
VGRHRAVREISARGWYWVSRCFAGLRGRSCQPVPLNTNKD